MAAVVATLFDVCPLVRESDHARGPKLACDDLPARIPFRVNE